MNPLHQAKQQFIQQVEKGKILKFHDLVLVTEEDEEHYRTLLYAWYQNITNLKFLNEVKNFDDIEEIYVHSPLNIKVKRASGSYLIQADITQEDLNLALDILAIKNKIDFNFSRPFSSFATEFFYKPVRATLIHYSTSGNLHSKLFIRFFQEERIKLSAYTNNTELFQRMIEHKKNIIISGATGSGKTTFINSLLPYISKDEHIVTIEDTKELATDGLTATSMVSDADFKSKSMKMYLTYSMRMSPERIILGEIRGAEVETALLAINTGHNGFLSTVHANSAKDAILRLGLLFQLYTTSTISYNSILKLITQNIDYVIHISNKQISEIIEVFGSNEGEIFFENVDFTSSSNIYTTH